MPNYESIHTGLQIDEAIKKALLLDTFTTATDVAISNVIYHTLWKSNPTTTSNIYGIAVHPSTGKLYQIYKNASNVYSATPYDNLTVVQNNLTSISTTEALSAYQGYLLKQSLDSKVINNATLTLSTSGTGLSGSQTFTANQSSAATFQVTLDSSSAGNRAANKVVIADAAGSIQTEKLKINSGTTTKAHMEYNTTDDCIDFIFD